MVFVKVDIFRTTDIIHAWVFVFHGVAIDHDVILEMRILFEKILSKVLNADADGWKDAAYRSGRQEYLKHLLDAAPRTISKCHLQT